MRKRILFCGLVAVSAILLLSCGNGSGDSPTEDSKPTSATSDSSYQKNSEPPNESEFQIGNNINAIQNSISVDAKDAQNNSHDLKKLAKECTKLYQSGNYPRNRITTDYIDFNNTKLHQWLSDMKGAKKIRVQLGVYTPMFTKEINDYFVGREDDYHMPFLKMNDTLQYRLTVFFFAMNGDTTNYIDPKTGKESSAYNLGNLHP